MKMGPLDSAWTSAPAPRDTLAVRRYPLDQVVLMHFGCPLSAVQHTPPVHDSSDMFCNDGRRQKHCCVEQGSSPFSSTATASGRLAYRQAWRGLRVNGRFAATTAQASITDYPSSCCVRAPSDQVMPVACMCRSSVQPRPSRTMRVCRSPSTAASTARQVAQSLAPQVHIAQLVVARQPQPQAMRAFRLARAAHDAQSRVQPQRYTAVASPMRW